MGYCTEFSLEVSDEKGIQTLSDEHHEAITENIDYDVFNGEPVKWYEHEEDMKEYSKNHSSLLFALKCDGEESGDLYIKYFKDGKMQGVKAKTTFEDFDESKLK